jgi:hypothetical protein
MEGRSVLRPEEKKTARRVYGLVGSQTKTPNRQEK